MDTGNEGKERGKNSNPMWKAIHQKPQQQCALDHKQYPANGNSHQLGIQIALEEVVLGSSNSSLSLPDPFAQNDCNPKRKSHSCWSDTQAEIPQVFHQYPFNFTINKKPRRKMNHKIQKLQSWITVSWTVDFKKKKKGNRWNWNVSTEELTMKSRNI